MVIFQHGLRGCGIKTAYNIARYTGLGFRLCHAFQNRDSHDFPAFLMEWRNDLRRTLTSETWLLGYSHRQAASAVTEDFPNISVLEKFTEPLTSSSPDRPAPVTSSWTPRLPDLKKLAGMCEEYFSWGTTLGIHHKLSENVWPGALLRTLLQVSSMATACSYQSVTCITPSHHCLCLHVMSLGFRQPPASSRQAGVGALQQELKFTM
jgi:holliday junction resolvase YEN1